MQVKDLIVTGDTRVVGKLHSKTLDSLKEQVDKKAPAYSYGTTDLTAGTSALETGKLYFVYE